MKGLFKHIFLLCLFVAIGTIAKADIPNNTIYYTTKDGKVCTPLTGFTNTDKEIFGANIVSNTYTDGQGIITFDGDVTSIGSSAFNYRTSLTSVTIPNSVTSIGDKAFYRCFGLTSVNLPSSVKSIGGSAFGDCSGLTSVTIGSSVTSIGTSAFYGCSSLTSVTIPNSVTSIGSSAFNYCTNLISVSIGSNVKSIGGEAFYGCHKLTSVTIPNSVTSIGGSAFSGCSGLTSVTIGSSVTSIGEYAFGGCSGLTSVTIPNSVTSIEQYAFYGCSGLTSVTIPSSVTNIDFYAFMGCSKLTSVICEAATPPVCSTNAFEVPTSATLYIPKGTESLYASANGWKQFTNKQTILKIGITDGQEFTNTETNTYSTLTYTRDFSSTAWQALYVPFSMSYEDWADDFEVARINDVHQYDDNDDGEIDRTTLELINMKSGSKTDANTPYLIKAKTTGQHVIELTDATLYPAEENEFDVTSWFTKYTFCGTYSTVSNMASNGYFAMSGGGLMLADDDTVTLSPFRWYLEVSDRYGNPASVKGGRIEFSFLDNETSGVTSVKAEAGNAAKIFNLNGVCVGTDKAALPKGLYIIDGKKVMVK